MQSRITKIRVRGHKQVVFIPKEFRLDTDEVMITRSGNRLILTPRAKTWDEFFEALGDGFTDDFSVDIEFCKEAPRKHLND